MRGGGGGGWKAAYSRMEVNLCLMFQEVWGSLQLVLRWDKASHPPWTDWTKDLPATERVSPGGERASVLGPNSSV